MKTKKKKRMSRAAIALVVGLVIIFIPCAIYGGILLEAIVNTGSPIVGHRFDNDLNPAITEADITNIQTKVQGIEGVEAVEINLPTGQLRINVDAVDTLTNEELLAMVTTVYESVTAVLPADIYFTASETMRMYDLAINVYNVIGEASDGLVPTEPTEGEAETAKTPMIYYQLTKNSKMEEANIQLVSEPVDAELVNNIYQEIKEAEAALDEQEKLEQEQAQNGSTEGETDSETTE